MSDEHRNLLNKCRLELKTNLDVGDTVADYLRQEAIISDSMSKKLRDSNEAREDRVSLIITTLLCLGVCNKKMVLLQVATCL